MYDFYITSGEKKYLRERAKRQLEYSELSVMKDRQRRWYEHNDLKGEIPMIHFETLTCEQDLMPALKCPSEAGRNIELNLNREVINHEFVGDDTVVSPWYNIGWDIEFSLFSLKIERQHTQDSQGRNLGHQFNHPIKNLKKDLKLLKSSVYKVNREKTLKWRDFVGDILGDILPVRMSMGSPAVSLSQHIVHMMGLEEMIYAMVDHAEEFHETMQRMTRDYMEYMRWLEREDLLVLNNSYNRVLQGTFGYTHDLPREGFDEKDIKTNDLWGYMDSQETVSISPEMFGEFFFPYYYEAASNFGLLSYGCCEPVDAIWEQYLSKLPNLRKVSISPWCNEEYMGEALKESSVIYHRKPSPNYLGVGKTFDEEAFRKHILKTIKCARECKLEFSFRDVYALNGDNNKPSRAVQIVREVIEENWCS